MKEEMFDVNKACEYLKKRGFPRSQGHIRRLIATDPKEGGLFVVRDFRAVRIPRSSLEVYIKQCRSRK